MTNMVAPASKAMQADRDLAWSVDIARDYIDRRGVVPADIVAHMTRLDYYRLLSPKSLGGLEMDPVEVLKIISRNAELDGSVGWIGMIYAGYSFFAGRLADSVSEEIFAARDSRVAGVMAPGGRATPVAGGYRLSGRWPFASGNEHAQWLLVGGLVWVDGGPEMDGPRPHIRLFFLPKEKFEVHDTWHVGGLRGTGSHDISLTDVFVEDKYSYNFLEDKPTRSEPIYRVPVFPLFSAVVAAATLGIARSGVNAYRHAAQKKVSYNSSGQQVSQADSYIAQFNLGKAQMLVDAAEAFLHSSMRELTDLAVSGTAPGNEVRARLRAACINVGINGVEAVTLLQKTLGTAAMFANSPLDKAFRDVNTASQHMCIQEKTLDTVGLIAFGKPPNGPV